jgi:hypothetical protein
MKANEAPKSKFVYPDKLYARTNNNITLDISYAPQTLEAVEYTRTDAFIEKACDVYCRLCDTKECGDTGECCWVEKFRKRLMKQL